ncbi:MAG TPA: hypothetical protein VGD42_03440 [Lysobacter sp.]
MHLSSFARFHRPLSFMRLATLLLCLLALAGCATTGTERNKLEQAQYAWSGAIRWGDFEGALGLIDPKVREKLTLTSLELERYKQVQISAYRDVGSSSDLEAGKAVRDIEIGVINRHNLTERSVRYREIWRWDAEAKTWWVTSELPNLWPN